MSKNMDALEADLTKAMARQEVPDLRGKWGWICDWLYTAPGKIWHDLGCALDALILGGPGEIRRRRARRREMDQLERDLEQEIRKVHLGQV